jgi:hypothetical protein
MTVLHMIKETVTSLNELIINRFTFMPLLQITNKLLCMKIVDNCCLAIDHRQTECNVKFTHISST